jgi:hypothetical protein
VRCVARQRHERGTCRYATHFNPPIKDGKSDEVSARRRPVAHDLDCVSIMRPVLFDVRFSVAPPHPRKTYWLSPAMLAKPVFPPVFLTVTSPRWGPGGNAFALNPSLNPAFNLLIATAVPSFQKPLSSMIFVASDAGFLLVASLVDSFVTHACASPGPVKKAAAARLSAESAVPTPVVGGYVAARSNMPIARRAK